MTSAYITVFSVCIRTDRPEETVWTYMKLRRMRRLIRVYTVCQSSSNILDTTMSGKLYLFKFKKKKDGKELRCPNN